MNTTPTVIELCGLPCSICHRPASLYLGGIREGLGLTLPCGCGREHAGIPPHEVERIALEARVRSRAQRGAGKAPGRTLPGDQLCLPLGA